MRTRANPRLLRRDGAEHLPTINVLRFEKGERKKALLNQMHNDKEKTTKQRNKNGRGTRGGPPWIQVFRQRRDHRMFHNDPDRIMSSKI